MDFMKLHFLGRDNLLLLIEEKQGKRKTQINLREINGFNE